MKLSLVKTSIVGSLTVAVLVSLTACSPVPESIIKDIPVNNMSASSELVAPVTVDALSLNGQDVKVKAGQTINIIVPQDKVEDWAGTSKNSDVAMFMPGSISGGTVTDPGFMTNKVGQTEATLTNTASGDLVVFTITVS